ncbi:transposase [Streptomyces tailanensis]|uniref:transposase n=1 Tax=Streptomyces tailanensis TaxID=2569858 RepID=UPI003CCC6228
MAAAADRTRVGQTVRAEDRDQEGARWTGGRDRTGGGLRTGRAEGAGRPVVPRRTGPAADPSPGGGSATGVGSPLLLGRGRTAPLARRARAATGEPALRFPLRHRRALLHQERHRVERLPRALHRDLRGTAARDRGARGHHDRPGPGRPAHRADPRRTGPGRPGPGRARGRCRLHHPGPRPTRPAGPRDHAARSDRRRPQPPGQERRGLREVRLHHRLGPTAGNVPPRQDQLPAGDAPHPGPRIPSVPLRQGRLPDLPGPSPVHRLGLRAPLDRPASTTVARDPGPNRLDQQTEQWQRRYAVRAGIEATLSQTVRSNGLRRTRYRGLAKTHVQHVLTAMACNLARTADWIAETPRGRTRSSRFHALCTAAAG